MQKVALGVLTFFGVVALIFEIISVATAAWLVSSFNSIGLWQQCILGRCTSIVDGSNSWFLWMSRIFALAATLSLFGAVIHSLRVMIQNYPLDAWATARGLPGSFVSAAILEIVALAVYTANVNLVPGVTWGYSYILGWLAVVLCVFLAIGSGLIIQKFRRSS